MTVDLKQSFERIQEDLNDPLQRKKLSYKLTKIVLVVFRTLMLIGLCFILLYPILYMLTMTFRPPEDIYDPSVVWVPKSLTMENINKVMELMEYWKVLWNSVQINLLSSLIQMIPCGLMGYALARFKFPGSKLMFGIVLLTIIIPPQLTIIPLARTIGIFDFFGIGKLGLLFGGEAWTTSLMDTPFAFYVPAIFGAGIKAGLFVFIFRQFFRNLPKELEDAAAIDGCGFFQTFIRVIVPNALTICLTILILSVVWYWNDYYYSSMFVPNFSTVSLKLTQIPNLYTAAENVALDMFDVVTLSQAGALLTILPILLMYIVLQRWFVQGVERSGLVG